MRQPMRHLALLVCAALLLSACSMPRLGLPRVHKVTVQQGNVITQEMIDKLKPGMSRSQVAYIMGEPVFRNPFNDDRWDNDNLTHGHDIPETGDATRFGLATRSAPDQPHSREVFATEPHYREYQE